MSPLLIMALSLTLNKPPGNAEVLQVSLPQPAIASSSWVSTVAQSTLPRITRQGEQITLNGQRFAAAWSQRQQEIGIADLGLLQMMGVELLDTQSAAQQPVSWFAEQPLRLTPWLSQQHRYLEITPLAKQFNWQVKVQGKTLNIVTPDAQVTGIRSGSQGGGDDWSSRIVVDLDQAAPWQVSQQPSETVITLEARLAPTLQNLNLGQSGQVRSFQVESSGDRTRLRISHTEDGLPRISSLANPHRLVIDLRPDALVERNIHWAPGVQWRQQWVTTRTGQFPLVMLELDPQQPGLALRPILSNPVGNGGTAPLSTAAKQVQAIAAINAGFFNRNNQLPLGAIRQDNRWVSGPILNRGAVGWNDAGEVKMGHLNLQETLTTSSGAQFTLQATNSGYVGAGVARYTPEWGRKYTTILDEETLISVSRNRIIKQKRIAKAGQTLSIPPDGYLLVVRANQTVLNALANGTTLEVESAIQPDDFSRYTQILGAGPLLLQNRQKVLNPEAEKFSASFIQEAAPRSIIATTAEGKLALITIHQRLQGAGPTLGEATEIMQQLGIVNALNLDGGSSATLYLGGQVLNRPASTAARIHNGIGVFIEQNP